MPKYAYECIKCEHQFEVYHSIKDKLADCTQCDMSGSLNRIPSITINISTIEKEKGHKVGDLVRSHIEETKQEVKKEKQKLKSVIYES
tara:strand:- start:343 stop:606 length:264 start_codon:yes stop_codon:yes gene_type:complete